MSLGGGVLILFAKVQSVFFSATAHRANETLEEKARWELQKNCVVFLNKSQKQHPIKQKIYGYLPTISQELQDMLGIAGEVRKNLEITFFYGHTGVI